MQMNDLQKNPEFITETMCLQSIDFCDFWKQGSFVQMSGAGPSSGFEKWYGH